MHLPSATAHGVELTRLVPRPPHVVRGEVWTLQQEVRGSTRAFLKQSGPGEVTIAVQREHYVKRKDTRNAITMDGTQHWAQINIQHLCANKLYLLRNLKPIDAVLQLPKVGCNIVLPHRDSVELAHTVPRCLAALLRPVLDRIHPEHISGQLHLLANQFSPAKRCFQVGLGFRHLKETVHWYWPVEINGAGQKVNI